jgi:hypothetical protein
MKMFTTTKVLTLAVLIAAGSAVYFTQDMWRTPDASLNPDPNHTHADFVVLIRNEQLDFSGNQFMSGTSADEHSHDEPSEYKHQHLHLHDNNGHVLHSHKPDLTFADFMQSLGALYAPPCLALNNVSYCPTTAERWQMFINGAEVPFDLNYAFKDLDKILISYASSPEVIQETIANFPDDACIYSLACPWRGKPPVEKCVADPEVPCVQPE